MQRAKDTASLQETAMQAEKAVLESSLAAALEQRESLASALKQLEDRFESCASQVGPFPAATFTSF